MNPNPHCSVKLVDLSIIEAGLSVSERIGASGEWAKAGVMSPDGIFRPALEKEQSLYAVLYNPEKLSPEEIFVMKLQEKERNNFMAEILSISKVLASASSSNNTPSKQQKYFYLKSGPDDPHEHLDKGLKWDLNYKPDDELAPLAHFLATMEAQNISKYIDLVYLYLGEHENMKQKEYLKIMKAEPTVLKNFLSIKIWNLITLEDKFMNALKQKKLIMESPVCSNLPAPYLPAPSVLMPIPTADWKSAALVIPDDQREVAKRKGVSGKEDPATLQKKTRQTGRHIDDVAIGLARNTTLETVIELSSDSD